MHGPDDSRSDWVAPADSLHPETWEDISEAESSLATSYKIYPFIDELKPLPF
jgi:hypothetical protein